MKKILLFFFAMLASGGLFSQIILLTENMDSYATNSFLGVDNSLWFTTWSNLPGSDEDAQILTNYAHSGTKSASADLINGPTDCVLKLGNKTSGTYEVKWWMYVENAKCGYYNIQHFESPGTEWAFEIFFRTDGAIHLLVGGSTINGTYPKATWFEVKQLIKLDVDSIYLYINGTLLNSWPFSWQASSTTGTKQLGSVDFFAGEESGAGETPGFYFDDVTITQLGTIAPTVVTTSATAVTSNAATLNGTVNANIMTSTVTFQYGLTNSYGTTVSGVPATVTGTAAVPVLANITGLLPGNTYHYRVVGANSNGTTNGNDLTFTTPPILPVVTTTAASYVGATTATINGNVNAGGGLTTVTFEYGPTNAYGTTVPGVPPTIGGNTVTSASAYITGLTALTTYHYRINGVNTVGPAHGSDMTFTTTSCAFPGPPGNIDGPATICAGSTGIVYSVDPILEATGYVWTVPSGASVTAGQNTNIITVTMGNTPGNVSVYGTNVCGNGPTSTLAVSVNPVPTPTITGSSSLCVNSGSYYYSTEAGMTDYIWDITGGTVTWGQGTQEIEVTWDVSGAQWVSVNYTDATGCPAPTPTVLPVTVDPFPDDADDISGDAAVCAGALGIAYTVPPIDDAIVYVWTLPQGATIATGEWTNSITVDFALDAVTGNISVYGNNLCGNGIPSPDFTVVVNPLPPPVITQNGDMLVSDAPAGNQWYLDGAEIEGATEQTYVPIFSGYYTCTVTLNGCVSAASNEIYVIITGIDSKDKDISVTIYPNPNDGRFTVTITSTSPDSYSISVMNDLGVRIREMKEVNIIGKTDLVIDLSPIANGIYTVIVQDSKNRVARKILVNK